MHTTSSDDLRALVISQFKADPKDTSNIQLVENYVRADADRARMDTLFSNIQKIVQECGQTITKLAKEHAELAAENQALRSKLSQQMSDSKPEAQTAALQQPCQAHAQNTTEQKGYSWGMACDHRHFAILNSSFGPKANVAKCLRCKAEWNPGNVQPPPQERPIWAVDPKLCTHALAHIIKTRVGTDKEVSFAECCYCLTRWEKAPLSKQTTIIQLMQQMRLSMDGIEHPKSKDVDLFTDHEHAVLCQAAAVLQEHAKTRT